MLRRLFALICCVAIEYNVAQVPHLRNRYKEQLIEDFLHRNYSRRDALNIAIRYIGRILERNRPTITTAALGITAAINNANDDNFQNLMGVDIMDDNDLEFIDISQRRNAEVERTSYDREFE